MNKKKIFLILFSFLIFIFLFSFVEAACSLGANPLNIEARVVPGQTVLATWNLYNLYGDRITHVKLDATEAPSDWKISFEPKLRKVTYSVMGVLQTIEENVLLKQTPVVKTIPETIPEGMDYVKHPKEEGYIPMKVVKIYVEVPENAELWKEHELVIGATGNCFTEPGAVVPGVATQLNLKVTTISEEGFTEVIPSVIEGEAGDELLKDAEDLQTTESLKETEETLSKTKLTQLNLTPTTTIIITLLTAIVILLIFLLIRKK